MIGFGKQMSRTGRALMAAVAVGALGAGAAMANPVAPSLKPSPTLSSTWLETSDFTLLTRALDAADDGLWSQVRSYLDRIGDPAAQALIRWRIATNGDTGMGYSDLIKAMEEFKGWPDLSKIEDQLEITIIRSSLTSDERIAWLLARGPQTGEGVLALADAYHSQGKMDDRLRVIREAWRARAMSTGAAAAIQVQFAGDLSAEDHFARADMFLWRGDTKSAQALLSKLSAGRRKIIEARIALMKNAKNVDKTVNAVPTEYMDDPGLLFDRARWAERKGRQSDELSYLLRINGETAPVGGREEIWGEKQSVMRRMIRERDYQKAYQLAAGHGLLSGEAFRDAEWMAGWLALEKLGDAAKAEAHFRVFGAGVATPISVSRAQYWLGEALTKQGRVPEAQEAYALAAKYPYVFYGQLAAEKVRQQMPEAMKISFALPAQPTDEERAAFAKRTPVRAAILLAETGRLASFERFSFALDDMMETANEHQMLFDIAAGYQEMRAAVRGAKAGLGRGLVAPDAVFPLMLLPTSPRTGSAEPALVLALSRQESEFNARAISGADARGLMQMIPRYAQAEAKKVGLPFKQSWLTDDPQYNLRLGRGFLDDLVDSFGGSYILAAAAYNAGPSRARQWINDFGDPRGEVDPVDWIESIPFAETRNYVQRVLENTQVYRHRLAGTSVDIQLSDDLRRGRPR
ncbi:MAG: transglycosylase SLT domain-containing protein [Hyphomonadaceae bacterium]|nr:transglycosylase SLT domain-containing protein [Hyphomonadaceae bacterium]